MSQLSSLAHRYQRSVLNHPLAHCYIEHYCLGTCVLFINSSSLVYKIIGDKSQWYAMCYVFFTNIRNKQVVYTDLALYYIRTGECDLITRYKRSETLVHVYEHSIQAINSTTLIY